MTPYSSTLMCGYERAPISISRDPKLMCKMTYGWAKGKILRFLKYKI